MKPDLWGGLGVSRTPPYPAAKRLEAETQVLGLRTRPEDVSPGEQTWRLARLVLPSQAECVCFGGEGSLKGLSPDLLAVAAWFAALPSLVFLL